MSVDIAYIVSHGFAARMVTQTDLLGKLVQSGLKVALIAPDIKDKSLVELCSRSSIELYEWDPKSNFWSSQYMDSRKYFYEDIEANVALLEKHIYATRFNDSKSLFNKLKPRVLFLIYKVRKYLPFLKTFFIKKEQNHLNSAEANVLLKKIDAKLLVSTYPVSFSEAMLLKSANDNPSYKTVIHLLSWDNISCKGFFPQLADEYISWGPIMKEEFISYYNIEDKNIHNCGVPHFDLHVQAYDERLKEEIYNLLNIKTGDQYIFFGMSSPRFAPYEIDIVEWLAKKVSEKSLRHNLKLVVRPHPQNVIGNLADLSWLPRLNKISELNNVSVYFPDFNNDSQMYLSMKEEDMVKMSILLRDSIVSINSGSTLIIDSLICDVPVILTSFDGDKNLDYWKSARRLIDFAHLKKCIKLNNIYVTNSYQNLEETINKLGSNRELTNNNISRQVSHIGHATETVVDTFINILKLN